MSSGGPGSSSSSATSLLLPILISAAAGAAISSAAWLFSSTPPSVRSASTTTTATAMPPPPEPTSSTSLATRDSVDNSSAAAAVLGSTDSAMAARPAESQNLLNLLYSIAEDQARKEGYVHRGITCNHCGSSPIRGTRFKCSNCVDFDVCENCEAQEVHNKTHVFLKIRIPIPPLANPRTALLNPFYPGNRHGTTSTSLDTLQTLQRTTHFDQLELEALDDQFRALATSDRGIPRSVYDQSLGPLGLEKNLITDRIFAFFDADHDGFISFTEFIHGLSVLCKGTLDEKIVAAFHGYDLDGDGKITRQELHAMFKAYFHLSMELVRDVVKAMEEEMMATFDEDANKPVSAAFTAPIPANAQGQQGQQANQGSGGGGSGGGGSQRPGSSRGGQRPSGGWQKGDDPDALMSGTSPSSFTSPVHASSSSAMATNAPAASSSSSGRLLGPGHQIADDAGFLSGGEDGGGQSVPATPIGSGFQWGASTSAGSSSHHHHAHHHHDRDPLSATSAHPPSSSAFLQTHRASSSVSHALAAAARRANSMAVASGAAGRHMSLDVGSPLGGAHGAHDIMSPGGPGAGGDRLQPIMEQMSQEAITEMVDKTFAAMDVEGKGWAEFEDFKRHVEMDPTIVNWFETLSSIF
ncbi:hypothetical protein BCR44DRAFT_1415683 [Catenaria anguillulae PL171]|uniref:Uncharacterized protein n=1 Tax=Catenaria anguillulae PL171 TaxID=765915 RepID=A0A1Y2HL06_9FUNG|nr:hypothetical protein BCR44DRAFT_1415683 [Catenaria anguillulae PL171]